MNSERWFTWVCCCSNTSANETAEFDGMTSMSSEKVMQYTLSIGFDKLPDEALGIEVETLDSETALVLDIKDGAFRRWNKENKGRAVNIGDKIIEVNGISGNSTQILQTLKSSSRLDLQLQRSQLVQVSLDLAGKDLGLSIVAAPRSATVMVKTVLPGAISEWNALNWDEQVKEGDRIYMVNGKYQNLNKVLEGLRKNDRLEMSVWAYP